MRRTKQQGRGTVEVDGAREYVALKRLRWGDGCLEIGDKVPIEPGRRYGTMVRRGDIQQVVKASKGRKGRK